ncbi:MAG: thioredoxin family protein [Bacteroidetes bacterium]|nr:thioredoxin family protein [Bacteroidota bacterium]MCW5895617.1 thioredoxin family protein [Bacteroidota bacterium]
MGRLSVMLFVLLLAGCSTKEAEKTQTASEKMVIGWVVREDFMQPEYPRFQENYDSYQVDENFVQMIQTLHEGVEVVVVLGTWCGDSKREVARFLKIADLATIPPSHIKFYGVDRTKASDDGVTERYDIRLVPTFIFLKHGVEIGRVVESPKTSMEEDLLVILADSQGR